jgi:ABC-type branched-subunit amino acid transport system ATPase component
MLASDAFKSEVEAKSPRLEVQDLVVAYGHAVVVDRVTFRVDPGECLGVVGANGAGKSSMFRCIAGMLRARAGKIRLDGRDVTRDRAWALAGKGLRLVPEGRELFGGLSVAENLRVAAAALPANKRVESIESAIQLFPALGRIGTRHARFLSGGEQQMLAIARAMVAKPSILLLDEPSLGLAPAIVGVLLASLKVIRDAGVSILIAEQSLKIPRELCNRVLVFKQGRIVVEGAPEQILTDHVLRGAFLGV